jgi:hypothetical protein
MRTEFGFARKVCACDGCKLNCKFMPGYLIPADLQRMIPEGADPKKWAEENLLASPGAMVMKDGKVLRVRTLVPKTKKNGECIHLTADSACGIHAIAPFGCAFFDCNSPMGDELAHLGIVVVMKAWEENGLYARLWKHLDREHLNQVSAEVLRKKMAAAIDCK